MSPPVPVILAVEDDPNDVALIDRAFRQAGSTAVLHVVGDGDAAVAYLAGEGAYADRSHHPFPHLVLLDLHLPRRDGIGVLAWIRAREPLRRLPVVVLTSSPDAPDVNRAFDAGANSYLVKPVAFEDLLHVIRTLNLYWTFNEKPEIAVG